MITVPTMRKTQTRPRASARFWRQQVSGMTILESLLVLSITTSLLLLLSLQVRPIFSQIRSQLFFLEFEHFYRESQQLSQTQGEVVTLSFSTESISNGYDELPVPEGVVGPSTTVELSPDGGNHSLAKLVFEAQHKTVSYQLYLGSGKYKKTEN